MKDRWDEAREVLAGLHGKGDPAHPLVLAEFLEIEEQLRFERENSKNSWTEMAKPKVAKRVFLGCGIQALSQGTGMNCMSTSLVFDMLMIQCIILSTLCKEPALRRFSSLPPSNTS
jgi:hypothetical protein